MTTRPRRREPAAPENGAGRLAVTRQGDPPGGPASEHHAAAAPAVVAIVERSDPRGQRWRLALELLLEAGRQAGRAEAD